MKTSEFDDKTWEIAGDLIIEYCDEYPALLRKTSQIQDYYIPAIFTMIAEVQFSDEFEEWS